ncbi:MAG: 30S ribosome-binding factor RbfA [Puniceicoccales bacterium]|jgi:ribosome-binding factor A|nr:30S ribosome-binding factor RbfA [Puniceicoccales bacterium]
MISPRITRLNKLVFRELNALLHTAFRGSAAKISITETSVSPDLHDAYVYFSVLGTADDIAGATKFLEKISGILRHRLFQRVRLKFSPRLNFRYDDSMSRGQNIIGMLDNLENGKCKVSGTSEQAQGI